MHRVLTCLLGFVVLAWALPSHAGAVSTSPFKLNGFFDLEYEKADGPGHPTTPVGDEKGSFDQYHFNLLMEFPVTDTLKFKGHVEFEHGPQISGSEGTGGGNGTGNVNVEWSYAELLLNNRLKLRGGVALTPFGLYNEIHDATPTFLSVRIPWSIYKATSIGGEHPFFPKFSTGLFLLGDYLGGEDFSVDYVLFISNGENTVKNEAEKDDNANKAVGGRATVSPISGLKVGASYYTGKHGTESENHETWGLGAEYDLYFLSLRGEYVTLPLADRTQSGWYTEGSFAVGHLFPFVRYEDFDPDDGVSGNEWTEGLMGVAYQFHPGVILKAEYRRFEGSPGNDKVQEDYNEWASAFTMGF